MNRKTALLILVTALVLALTACSGSGSGTKKHSSGSSGTKVTKAYEAYQKVLEDNKSKIEAYNWQVSADSRESSITRPVALSDINSDGIPELFFMSAANEYEADLSIYTYADGAAQKVTYKRTENGNSYDSYADVAAGGGSRYVIYRGSGDADHFVIMGISTDEDTQYCLSEYDVSKLTSDRTLTESTTLTNTVTVSPKSDVYKKDGNAISNSDGKKAFSDAFSDVDKVILFSGYDSSCSIWNNFKAKDAASKSYDDMMSYLDSKTK